MKRFIPEVKSVVLGFYSKNVCLRFCWFWRLRKSEKQVAAEKGHTDFYIGGLRHFHTFALVVEENFMHNLSVFSLFLETKKE